MARFPVLFAHFFVVKRPYELITNLFCLPIETWCTRILRIWAWLPTWTSPAWPAPPCAMTSGQDTPSIHEKLAWWFASCRGFLFLSPINFFLIQIWGAWKSEQREDPDGQLPSGYPILHTQVGAGHSVLHLQATTVKCYPPSTSSRFHSYMLTTQYSTVSSEAAGCWPVVTNKHSTLLKRKL